MADVPVEVKKAAPTETTTPDVWRSFRSEMDRLFDRFGFPSLRRMFDMEPAWRPASSFTFSVPAIDMSEDEKAYKISAELPGLDAKDVDVSVSGNMLVLKGEKVRKRRRRTRIIIFPSAPTARSSARSSCRRASIATKSQPTSLRAC
jgi:HSP20 family protein